MKTNILLIIAIFFSFSVHAQNQPVVLAIDGVNTTFQSGLSLPYWLKAGQTLNLVANACSVSIMEFTEDTTSLKYSRVISLNSLQTVPSGKIWKIEAIGTRTIGGPVVFSPTSIPTFCISPKTFSQAGTYTWIVPPNVTSICVEVWGGGGNGGMHTGMNTFGGGGGGGGYGYQCFAVLPGTVYTVTVGGPSGTSSLGSLISATGGAAGMYATPTANGAGGAGGGSTATFNISGSNGTLGAYFMTPSNVLTGGSAGGAGTNGGQGGDWGIIYSSIAPGGGGSGGGPNGGHGVPGGAGAPGKVIIYW
jgi:hypothetical protein